MYTKEKQPDPLNQYGYGMMAYKDLMFTLSVLFAVMSVIMLPAMIYYNSQQGMPVTASFSQFSLGNFGYSTSQCQVSPYSLKSIPMKCPYGKLTSVVSFGVISETEARKDICNTEKLTSASEKCKVVAGIDSDIMTKYRSQVEADQRKRTYLYKFSQDSLFGVGTTIPAECTGPEARVFASFNCQQDQEQL